SSKYTQPKEKGEDSERIRPFASRDVNASDGRDLIRGASERGDGRGNSRVLHLTQKLVRHPSRGPVLSYRNSNPLRCLSFQCGGCHEASHPHCGCFLASSNAA